MFSRMLAVSVVCWLVLCSPTAANADETVPMKPCRVMDTRLTGVGYLPPGSQLDFAVRTAPTAPGPTQGGQSGCGVPYNATAVSLHITAVQPSNNGHVHLWAFGDPQPTISVLNVTIALTENGATFAMMAANGPSMDLSIKNVGFSTYWVIDVTGYTVPSTATLVGQATGILFGNVLTVETAGGVTIKVFAPDSMPLFKASWTSTIPDVVGQCVHVDGLWFHATSTIEYNTVEARGLPIAVPGYCGPG